jgi:diguanylate cyclase (GGDEF)-like protein/PAS domain S-box-containing protein
LQAQVSAIAETIDPDLVASLTSDDQSVRMPALVRLGRQIGAYQQVVPDALIQTHIRVEGEHRPDHAWSRVGGGNSEPIAGGELLDNLDGVVSRAKPLVFGPYPGADGAVIGAFAPVAEIGEGRARLVVELSIGAGTWRSLRIAAALSAISRILPLAMIVILGIGVLWYRQASRASGARRLRNAEAIIVGVLGFAATLTVASIFYSNDTRAQAERFSYIAQSQAQRLNATLHMLVGGHLDKLTQYYLGSDDVTQSEFATFAGPMMRRDPLAFIGWGPRVHATEREAFVERIRSESATQAHAEFDLRSAGEAVATPMADEHHPLLFAVGEHPAFTIGADLGRHRRGDEHLGESFSTSFPVHSDDGRSILIAVRALPEHANLRFLPPSAHRIGPDGLLAIGIDLDRLLQGAVRQAEFGGSVVGIDLYELAEGAAARRVASSASFDAAESALDRGGCLTRQASCAVFPILVGGGAYALVLRPDESFAENSLLQAAVPALAFGFLLTFLAVALSLFVISRREASERAVRLRTIALKESEERFRTLLSSMNDVVIVYDREGVHREIIRSRSGYGPLSPESYIGKRIEDTPLPAPTRALIARAIDSVIASGEPATVDYTLDLPAGTKWFSANISPLRDNQEELNGLIGVARDITERKQAELSLMQREAFLRQLMALSAQFVNVRAEEWDATVEAALARIGSFCEADRSYLFLLDSMAGTISNTHEWVADGIAPQASQLQAIALATLPKGVAMLLRHETIVIGDVAELPPEWAAEQALFVALGISSLIMVPVLDGERLVGFVGFDAVGRKRDWSDEGRLLRVFADILSSAMARRRADEALRRSETRYREVVNKVREVIFETDREGRWVFLNKAFEEITGYSSGESLGLSLVSFIDPADRKEAAARLATMMSGEVEALRHEVRCRTSDGGVRWAEIACEVNRDADGAITGTFGTLMDITERRAALAEIERLAFYDTLTQLPNRRLLMQRLGEAIAHSSVSGRNAALLFIDLDNFKTLNDTYGHAHGDMLLRIVGQRLSHNVGSGDVVARLGGDEFVVIVQNLGVDGDDAVRQARAAAERIRRALRAPYDLEGVAHHFTPSIGATVFAGDERAVETLLRHADLAMYQAKTAGRNNIQFFTDEMEDVVVMRAGLEADLRGAIERDEFAVHLQPQVDHAGNITGAEALLRWFHPQRGFVSPCEFIPVAEETGLIVPIGRWVFEQACSSLIRLQQTTGRSNLSISVNISPRQFRNAAFVEEMRTIIATCGLAPERLKLELTESLFLQDIDFVIDKMQQLRRLGLRFSLDDFGTGYSSLTYLKRLPFDEIKIDQSFVADITESAQDATIARTIIRMGHALGLSVIAEGVETAGQLALLLEAGCQGYQGYLFGRPQSLDSFEEMLRTHDRHPQKLIAS